MSELDTREWLEPDGLGGFASGTVSGIRTRRYHALLLTATTPPTGRMVLVNGFEAWVETSAGRFAISSQRYRGDVVSPDGATRIEVFTTDPWPTWTYRMEDGTRVQQQVLVPDGRSAVLIAWRLISPPPAGSPVRLIVRPLLSGRDYHALHHENNACNLTTDAADAAIVWRPYGQTPAIASRSNGTYSAAPDWYRGFHYSAEAARGLDADEDLMTPGSLTWDLRAGEALWLLEPGEARAMSMLALDEESARLRQSETTRRSRFQTPLHRAADAYVVRRGRGCTIVAGYPWFTDWGRDTFVALRGLCFATGRHDQGRDILLEWARTVSEGMLPNRFPDAGDSPEYNAVDASLWFVIAVRDLCQAAERDETALPAKHKASLLRAVGQILDGYTRGTRYGIRADADGLLACGESGVQLTWMDARIGDRVITPRIGKPVEVQALWANALAFGAADDAKWRAPAGRAAGAFAARFWNEAGGCLYDVVDVDHVPGRVDDSMRPNQIYAVGGLGSTLIAPARARQVVDAVERTLVTPGGVRTLAPDDSRYVGQYRGGPVERDEAYHQGTAWPYLMGAFVEGWIHVRGGGESVCRDAAARFLTPLEARLTVAGLGHLSEVVDGDVPYAPGGCPFQAWSLGELLRTRRLVGLDRRSGGPAVSAPRHTRRTPDRR